VLSLQKTEQVFVCAGRPQLRVNLRRGHLFIRGWDGAETRIEGAQGQEVSQKGDGIRIDSSRTREIQIYLPRASDVFVDGAGLEVDVGGVHGICSIDIGAAPINVEDWQGDLEIDGTNGPVRLSRCQGQAEIDMSRGDVEISSSQGNFRVDTGAGSVSVLESGGSLQADTGFGAVTLGRFRGPVHIDTGSGDVVLKEVAGRNVYVDTGRGNIEAALPGASPGRWQLDAGLGSINLQVPSNTSAHFEFHARHVDIQDLELDDYRRDGNKVTGDLNQAQGRVIASSSVGKIFAGKVSSLTVDEQPPVQDEDFMRILTMLEQGRISTQEAESLLDALKGGEEYA